jgi:hypothetical protein
MSSKSRQNSDALPGNGAPLSGRRVNRKLNFHGEQVMYPDVLIVRENDGYRVLHGHLHLASMLSMAGEADVVAVSEGTKKVVKTRGGIKVRDQHQHLPLLRQ